MLSVCHIAWFCVLAFLVRLIHFAGELHLLAPNVPPECTHIADGHHGFEDLTRVDGGFVAASSDHGHFKFVFGTSMREKLAEKHARASDERARLWFIPDDASGSAAEITFEGGDFPQGFFPHGLAGAGRTLVVVNHRPDRDALEVFTITRDKSNGVTARHVRSVTHELLFNANDCAISGAADGVGKKLRIRCTNWRSQETGTLGDLVEVYGQMPWTNVVGCVADLGAAGAPVQCAEVASGLRMANGIEVDADGTRVAVVSSLDKQVVVYAAAADGDVLAPLREVRRVGTRGACDNLMWTAAPGGGGPRLLSGCHPQALTFTWYSKEPHRRHAPCEVVRLAVDGTAGDDPVESLFLDDRGWFVSACSVAAVAADGALLVGSVHGRGVVRCPRGAWERAVRAQAATRSLNALRVAALAAVVAVLFAAAPWCCWPCGCGRSSKAHQD